MSILPHLRRCLPTFLVASLLLAGEVSATDLAVPGGYATIQAAINAAAPGDRILLAAGKYNETLVINKDLTVLGSGTNDCSIYAYTNIPIITIAGPAKVQLSNFEIFGGQYAAWNDWYNGVSPYGITATNATLGLDTVNVSQIINYVVTVVNGSLRATNVSFWTRDLALACDVGFQLKGCNAYITNLVQDVGRLDHTINVNDPPALHSDVVVDTCRIRASKLSYGNCIRTYTDSSVLITNCYFYRATNDAVPAYPGFNHNGVSVSGYSNTVTVAGNVFTNLPWSMYCVGSLGGNRVLIENNRFLNSAIGGILWDSMSYRAIDLGGGALGSRGGNVFSELPAPLTNFLCDILITNFNGASSASIFALHNTWSNPTNCDAWILDKLHVPAFGRVINADLTIKTTDATPAGNAVLTWNERGANEKYTLQYTSDLTAAVWTNCPGVWPKTNTTLADMGWTNSVPNPDAIFYRISSVVP